MTDYRDYPESMEEKLDRLGACGMSHPNLDLRCLRPKGHKYHIIECFSLIELHGFTKGVWMRQDGKDWVSDPTQFPTDLVVSKPLMKSEIVEQIPDRRAAIAHTKALS